MVMTTIATPQEVSEERSLSLLEDEIATLSATIQAATYRLLCLVEEYDRRGGWADPLASDGFRSVAHWLSWRVGLSLTTARQQVAVARKLPEMPKVSAAFAAGEVSYSKVRAISRVVTPETEDDLLVWAKAGTASQLEKIVRQYRRARGAAENEQAQEQDRSRSLTTYWDSDGMLVVRGRLPPEQGSMLLKALDRAKDDVLRTSVATREILTSEEALETVGPCCCDSHREPAERVDDVSAEASPVLELALSEDCAEPAERADDVSAEASPVLELALSEDCAEPAECAEASPVASSVTRTPCVELTGQQLMADALGLVAEQALAHRAGKDRAADRFQVVVHVDGEVLAEPEADGRCDLEDGPALAPETVRRLTCDCTVRPMLHGPRGEIEAGRKSRVVGAALRRALTARDGSGCAFPGCGCRGRDAHHVEHWARGGETVLENLLSLCRYHHTLVHEGGYRVETLPDGRFRFLRPDGREVPASPPLLAVEGEAAQILAERWLPSSTDITPSTGSSPWQGERVDYDIAVETLWVLSDRDAPAVLTDGNRHRHDGLASHTDDNRAPQR